MYKTYGRRMLTLLRKTEEHDRVEIYSTDHFKLFHSFILQILTEHLLTLDSSRQF